MTTRILIYNQSPLTYFLNDTDGNFFSKVNAFKSYSLKLNYSATFEKQYILTASALPLGLPGNIVVNFWLDIDGELLRVTNVPQINLLIGCNGQNFVSDNELIVNIGDLLPCQQILTIVETNA